MLWVMGGLLMGEVERVRHVLLGCCEVGGASQSHSRPCGDAGLLPSLNFNTPAHCSQPCMCLRVVCIPHFGNHGINGTCEWRLYCWYQLSRSITYTYIVPNSCMCHDQIA
jgi:hypothetical protein